MLKVKYFDEKKLHLINSQKKLFYNDLFVSCLCFHLWTFFWFKLLIDVYIYLYVFLGLLELNNNQKCSFYNAVKLIDFSTHNKNRIWTVLLLTITFNYKHCVFYCFLCFFVNYLYNKFLAHYFLLINTYKTVTSIKTSFLIIVVNLSTPLIIIINLFKF